MEYSVFRETNGVQQWNIVCSGRLTVHIRGIYCVQGEKRSTVGKYSLFKETTDVQQGKTVCSGRVTVYFNASQSFC